MWNWLRNLSGEQEERTDDARHQAFSEVAKKFQAFESVARSCGQEPNAATIACLTRVITLADEILELIRFHQLGNQGIVRSQTVLYLTLALRTRADCYWQLGCLQEVDTQVNCRAAIKDYNRVEELVEEFGNDAPVSMLPERRIWCYLELSMFNEAITEARELCDVSKSTDNFIVLSSCYRRIGDYDKAITAATDAIRYTHNNYSKVRAFRNRGSIYQEMGQTELGRQDYQAAERYT